MFVKIYFDHLLILVLLRIIKVSSIRLFELVLGIVLIAVVIRVLLTVFILLLFNYNYTLTCTVSCQPTYTDPYKC